MLRIALGLLSFTLLGAFAAVLLASAGPRPGAVEVVADLVDLRAGELRRIEAFGRPLFILRPSAVQWESIRALDEHVWDRQTGAWFPEQGVFVYWGLSRRGGRSCALSHWSPGESPFAGSGGFEWPGGYGDPLCEIGYDYAGRAIATWKYSYNGWIGQAPNLFPPPGTKFEGSRLIVRRVQ